VGRHSLGRGEHGNHLAFLHRVPLVDHQLVDASGDLRADHDFMRRDDAGEDDFGRATVAVPVVASASDDGEQHDDTKKTFHGFKHMYKTSV